MAHEPNHFRFLCESLATESYSRIRYQTTLAEPEPVVEQPEAAASDTLYRIRL